MSYGYTLKDRMMSRIKRFFLKTFIIGFVVVGASVYFFKSDFGNSVGLIKDFKDHTNSQISNLYDTQTTEFSNAVRKDLGLPPVPAKNNTPNIAVNNSTESKPVDKTANNDKTVVENKNKTSDVTDSKDKELTPEVTNTNDKAVEKPVELVNNSGFTLYKIPFYYDHSNAPSGVSKQEALNIINKASQQWLDACGVTFEYKGDKLADYVNNKNVIAGQIGIIKWETQMEGSAIGEAHVGNYMGPAPGFVLALFSDFFVSNKADLVNTITHEMGHVIGLDHSTNKHSIMFDTENKNSKLQESDKAMCRYYRYRWAGMNEDQAQEKAGILSNSNSD